MHKRKGLTTNELADALGILPESIRSHVYRHGSYYGLKPSKLPNGRLVWPPDSPERLTNQGPEAA